MKLSSRFLLMLVLASVVVGGVGCGGKDDTTASSAPVAKPNPNEPAPTMAGKPMSEGAPTKMSEEGATVQKK